MGDDDERYDDPQTAASTPAAERQKPAPPEGSSDPSTPPRFVSRGGRGGRFRRRERYPRHRRQSGIDELIGQLIAVHGLTDRVGEQCVYMFWPDIVGERIAKRTLPDAITEGALKVWVQTSVWMHELRFCKPKIIAQVNDWIAARRVWLGSPPAVSDIRFVLGTPREPIADRDQLRRLQRRYEERRQQARRTVAPPAFVPESCAQAIRAETQAIEDDGLRAIIEDLRVTWNR